VNPHAYIRLRILPNGRYQVRWTDRQQRTRHLHFATRSRARAFAAGLSTRGGRDVAMGRVRIRAHAVPRRVRHLSVKPAAVAGRAGVACAGPS
jgi:hypothetical protein